MKRSLLFVALGFLSAAGFAGAPPHGPVKLDEVQSRIDKDLAAGKLTQNDADLLKVKVKRIERMKEEANRGGGMTKRTRIDAGQDVQQLRKEIERMEKHNADAKAAASAAH